MNVLELSRVDVGYGSGSEYLSVLKGIDLTIKRGEFIAILGFSGAGKTTLISTLAGIQPPDQGVVLFNNSELDGPSNELGVVFQSYSLMPWLTVRGNIELAVASLRPRLSRREISERVGHYVDLVGLSAAVSRRPAELSGGMRQRVAVARALSMKPEVLLMDEPLSALDALTRARLQDEFAEISAIEKSTIVLVTNDVDEALLLADRVLTLTPAPAATLGKEFIVDIEKSVQNPSGLRKRDRTAMNSNDRYIKLRAEITAYLLSLNNKNKEQQIVGQAVTERKLPNVVPLSLDRKTSRLRKPAKTNSRIEPSTIDHDQDAAPQAVIEASRSPFTERYLEYSDTGKTYPTDHGPLDVVSGFDLQITKGEFVSLIGHSGCGKSTVLSMTSGLNAISSGGIILDGQHIETAGPDRAVVFQAPSLMPWLTAFENVALGVNRVYPAASRAEREEIVEYYLCRVGLEDSMHRISAEMSNGMQQRVGIARAFALSPKLLLLDEPFGMLDSLTRWELQDVLMEVWAKTQVTTICVTHDVDEAILLADRVVMMSNGPEARVGNIMEVDLPRPRSRAQLLRHPDYYAYREELLDFLEAYEGGANPSQEVLDSIARKRELRVQESVA